MQIELNYTNSKAHYPQLDGIRGFAVFLILFFHCFSFLKIAEIGWSGVDLFFVLSGFLITGILLDAKSEKHFFRNFYIKRALRILPLYYGTLIVFFVIVPLFSKNLSADYLEFKNTQIWYWTYLQNIMNAFRGRVGMYLNHFWSLAIEEQFYIFWPLIVYLLPVKRTIIAIVLLLLLGLSIRISVTSASVPIFSYCFTFTRLDSILFGALIACLIRLNRVILNKFTIPLFLISLLFLVFKSFWSKEFTHIWRFFIVAVFWASVLLLSLYERSYNPIRYLATLSVFRFLGKYSYCIYVVHFPLFLLLFVRVTTFFAKITSNNSIVLWCTGFTVCLLTIIVSLLSFYFFEKPIMNLRKYFVRNS